MQQPKRFYREGHEDRKGNNFMKQSMVNHMKSSQKKFLKLLKGMMTG